MVQRMIVFDLIKTPLQHEKITILPYKASNAVLAKKSDLITAHLSDLITTHFFDNIITQFLQKKSSKSFTASMFNL